MLKTTQKRSRTGLAQTETLLVVTLVGVVAGGALVGVGGGLSKSIAGASQGHTEQSQSPSLGSSALGGLASGIGDLVDLALSIDLGRKAPRNYKKPLVQDHQIPVAAPRGDEAFAASSSPHVPLDEWTFHETRVHEALEAANAKDYESYFYGDGLNAARVLATYPNRPGLAFDAFRGVHRGPYTYMGQHFTTIGGATILDPPEGYALVALLRDIQRTIGTDRFAAAVTPSQSGLDAPGLSPLATQDRLLIEAAIRPFVGLGTDSRRAGRSLEALRRARRHPLFGDVRNQAATRLLARMHIINGQEPPLRSIRHAVEPYDQPNIVRDAYSEVRQGIRAWKFHQAYDVPALARDTRFVRWRKLVGRVAGLPNASEATLEQQLVRFGSDRAVVAGLAEARDPEIGLGPEAFARAADEISSVSGQPAERAIKALELSDEAKFVIAKIKSHLDDRPWWQRVFQ